MGADAVSLGTAVLIALNCNRHLYVEDYAALGTKPGFCHNCHTGRCPVGITTQDPELEKRLEPDAAARRVRNYLSTLVLETQTLARACGKSHVHNLEPEDLAALTVEAARHGGIASGRNKLDPRPLAGLHPSLTPSRSSRHSETYLKVGNLRRGRLRCPPFTPSSSSYHSRILFCHSRPLRHSREACPRESGGAGIHDPRRCVRPGRAARSR